MHSLEKSLYVPRVIHQENVRVLDSGQPLGPVHQWRFTDAIGGERLLADLL